MEFIEVRHGVCLAEVGQPFLITLFFVLLGKLVVVHPSSETFFNFLNLFYCADFSFTFCFENVEFDLAFDFLESYLIISGCMSYLNFVIGLLVVLVDSVLGGFVMLVDVVLGLSFVSDSLIQGIDSPANK